MKRLAVIGCGLRSNCYLREMRDGMGRAWEIAALADPRPLAREVYLKNYGNPGTRSFESGPELLRAMQGRLNAVIIASPNSLHRESLLPAASMGLTILLEKPVATTYGDLAAMWRAYRRAGQPPLAVGFVMRYTSFYRKVRAILDSGQLGQVIAIEATEMLGAALSAAFMRTWRRKHELSGPIILEKCSHDMDLLNWFAGAPPVNVASFARRTRFVPLKGAAMYCRECRFKRSCRFSARNLKPYLINVDPSYIHEIGPLIPVHEDLCVFNSDKDVVDHQVINIEYANGVLATFTMCTDQPRTQRTIQINGTQGQLRGVLHEDEIRVVVHPKADSNGFGTVRRFPIRHDTSGHHGGDSVISGQFKRMLRGQPVPPSAGLREGIEASMLSLAAQQASDENRVVDLRRLRRKVFGR